VKALWLLLRIGFHSLLLVFLPFFVGLVTALFAEVSEVSETAGELVTWASYVLVPVLFIQIVVIGIKVRRERKALEARGAKTPLAMLEALERHVHIITPKGFFLMASACVTIVLALSLKWAEFGVAAIFCLAVVYVVATVGMIVSGFVVTGFSARTSRRGGRIERQMSPAVVLRGDPVEERFNLEHVPVPPGFHLVIHDPLPPRLETESRYVADAKVRGRSVTMSSPIRRTPRGHHAVGPAHIWYQDLLGITKISVVEAATSALKVLPRIQPIQLGDPPRSRSRSEDALTILQKFPTEDLFRFREYLPQDDTRRINWKLSIRVGKLHVRTPETIPVSRRKVRLVLDTFLPPTHRAAQGVLEDALDVLAEAWVSLARALVDRGETVSLVAIVPGPGPGGRGAAPGKMTRLEIAEVVCRRGEQPIWSELAARVAWQEVYDLDRVVDAPTSVPSAPGKKGDVATPIVVTARFAPLPPFDSGRCTWVYLDPAVTVGSVPVVPPDRPGAQKVFLSRYPAGAEENSILHSMGRSSRRAHLEKMATYATDAIRRGAGAAEGEIKGRGEAFYRLSRAGAAYRLESR
jgi:uncharacterized protein (DUF58 family)